MRLATLAPQGRITTELVQAEIARLRWLWQDTSAPAANVIPAKANPDGLDLFDACNWKTSSPSAVSIKPSLPPAAPSTTSRVSSAPPPTTATACANTCTNLD